MDAAVAGVGVELAVESARKFERDRAVAGRDRPIGGRGAAARGRNLHAAVAGVRSKTAKNAVERDAPVARRHADVAGEIPRVNAAIARPELDASDEALRVDRS